MSDAREAPKKVRSRPSDGAEAPPSPHPAEPPATSDVARTPRDAVGSYAATRVALGVAGAIGVSVVAKTATFYLGVDRVAFALALVIGAGFVAGMGELFARVARVRRTAAELVRLPRPATTAAIDAADPALRMVLRARLTGARAAVPTAGFASYLVGLLVMVGLLGTFLGLVDALRGAREALGAGSDIDALRAALATPMLGLGRAFGISAAGLTASAMLGLASVFARRTEVALGRAVHAYADEELGPLTVAERAIALSERQLAFAERQQALTERQIALLEAMTAANGEAAAASARATEAILAATTAVRTDVLAAATSVRADVTAAAAAMRVDVGAAAASMRADVTAAATAMRADATSVADVVRTELATAATSMRADVASGVEGVGRAVEVTLTPALERAVARASDVTRERLDAWSAVVEADAAQRRARDLELAARWSDLAGESAERVAREGTRMVGVLQGVLGEGLTSLDARLGASVDALATTLATRSAATADDLERRLGELTRAVAAMIQGLGGELEGTRERLDRSLEAVAQAITAQSERTAARDAAREASMEGRTRALAEAEAHALGRLERHVDAIDAALADHLARLSTAQTAAGREAVARASALEAALRDHAASLTARTTEVLAEATRRAEAAVLMAERVAAARADEIAERTEAERRQIELRVEAERELAETRARAEREASEERARAEHRSHERRAEAEREQLALRAQTEREQIARAEAAELAHAARIEAAEQAQAARSQMVLAALASATEQIVSRTTRVLDEQAANQAALEARWLAAHEASAARLVTLLGEHAGGIDQGLASTRALVDDAAGLLRASGVEMGSVAEVFTAAVDRYRDASAAALHALAGVDDAVDRAGKKAAIELLTDYLDQTREVFDHSLEVQRELFAELRALRARGAASEATRVRA